MLKLYNTLSKEKEEFTTLEEGVVKMYSCGPTVYGYAHIGNMRTYIFMDILKNVLKYNGYKVKHVMNITDVGHLVSDADEGEDKMSKAAREENKSPWEIAKYYTECFMNDIRKLNIDKPETIAKATDHIKEMEEYVKKIVENGYGYETSKGIYFEVSKLPSYGELSKVILEDQKAGARIEVDTEKRGPLDFALWIKAPQNHIMKWDSQFGVCYPGWHIECSAMSKKYLGEVFDIHTGGVDHIPIHHENEIAQSRGCTGKNPAKFWMHSEFLLINSGKMSKSLKNVYTIKDLEEKGIEPLAFRYFSYSSHYRNKLNFTWEAMKAANISLNRLRQNYKIQLDGIETIEEGIIEEYKNRFKEAINDDLNMPSALSIVWEVAKNPIKSNQFAKLLLEFDDVLSFDISKEACLDFEVPVEVEKLLEERKIARENKDFASSDILRDKIKDFGYIVKDTKDGQKLEEME